MSNFDNLERQLDNQRVVEENAREERVKRLAQLERFRYDVAGWLSSRDSGIISDAQFRAELHKLLNGISTAQ